MLQIPSLDGAGDDDDGPPVAAEPTIDPAEPAGMTDAELLSKVSSPASQELFRRLLSRITEMATTMETMEDTIHELRSSGGGAETEAEAAEASVPAGIDDPAE